MGLFRENGKGWKSTKIDEVSKKGKVKNTKNRVKGREVKGKGEGDCPGPKRTCNFTMSCGSHIVMPLLTTE